MGMVDGFDASGGVVPFGCLDHVLQTRTECVEDFRFVGVGAIGAIGVNGTCFGSDHLATEILGETEGRSVVAEHSFSYFWIRVDRVDIATDNGYGNPF